MFLHCVKAGKSFNCRDLVQLFGGEANGSPSIDLGAAKPSRDSPGRIEAPR
jgi:hypothetical protein